MTSASPPGAGGGDPKAPVREPLRPEERDASRYAPRPPSERGKDPGRRPAGVGVFRATGWGWGLTIALFAVVGSVMLFGYLRDDPGRNPAPAGYRTAVCDAFAELSAGTAALQRGVAGQDDPAQAEAGKAEIESHVEAAGSALADLPEWTPGRSLNELLGAQIITLSNGAAALASGGAAADLEVARTVDGQGHEALSDGRYGFTCDA